MILFMLRDPRTGRYSRSVRFFFFLLALLFLGTRSGGAEFSSADRTLLLKIEKDSARYFFDHTNPSTGLTKDSSRPGAPASIAATGFALTVFAISAERGWISRAQAYDKVKKTLKYARDHMEQKGGFYYHFVSPTNGKRTWNSEISSMDTALFMAGALTASQMLSGKEVRALADQLYKRINWRWMTNGTDQLSHGWTPEQQFLPYYWDSYSEQLLLQALAHGSNTHPPPPQVWLSWKRKIDSYEGHTVVYAHTGSLFTYQFPHAFIDFRKLRDGKINYFKNSISATLANRDFCLNHKDKYRTYGPSSWGLTACIGPFGYRAYGARPGLALHDGTIAPYGAAGSLPFTPERSMAVLRHYYETYGSELYGKYGFRDAFNLSQDWVADEWMGIDQGLTVLMIENALSGSVWKNFMTLECIQRWIERMHL